MYLPLILIGVFGTTTSKSASSSRSVWIGLTTMLSVAFSFVIVGYLTSRLWKNELSYSGVGTLTAFQVFATYTVQKTWEWTQTYTQWVVVYVCVSGAIGLALSRGFVPETIDPRFSVALETLIVAVSVFLITYSVPYEVSIPIGCASIVFKVYYWDAPIVVRTNRPRKHIHRHFRH